MCEMLTTEVVSIRILELGDLGKSSAQKFPPVQVSLC